MNKNKIRQPKIRFKEFSGENADSWEQRKLGELSSSFEYGLNAAAKEYDGENKYIRITDIDDESREFKQEDITSPDTDLSSAENYKLSEGDILFARTGASVGKSYIYKASDGLVYYAGFLIRARIKPEYNSEFVFQNTLTGNYEKFIKVTSMRSGQPGVNAQEYSQYQIMMPSKPEQDKISDCLRNLDNLITLHQRKLDGLKKLKKTMLSKMFPKHGQNTPELRFQGFTDSWEQRKLSEVAEFNPKSELPEEFEYVDLESVVETEMIAHRTELKTAAPSRAQRLAKTGDVFYQTVRPYQRNNYLFEMADNNYVFSTGYAQMRPYIDSNYLMSFIQTDKFVKVVLDNCTGTSYPAINSNDLSNLEINIPKESIEQKKIGMYFKNLDSLITLHQRKIDDYKKLKKTMLSKMFI